MHLFLVRHGETEHNVAGLLAGVTDSKLTNHGVLQTQRLAKHLINNRKLRFSHVYASDLQRAYMTAEEVTKAQNELVDTTNKVSVVQLELLREQDFGSLELVSWSSRHDANTKPRTAQIGDADFKPKETAEAMKKRAENFVKDFIYPLYAIDDEEIRVAVVSHGLFLGSLWRVLLALFTAENVVLSSTARDTFSGRPFEHLPSWTNTGYLELLISSAEPASDSDGNLLYSHQVQSQSDSPFRQSSLKINAINCKEHLLNLKRTRGGVGSAAFDERQRNIDAFFKKPKTGHNKG